MGHHITKVTAITPKGEELAQFNWFFVKTNKVYTYHVYNSNRDDEEVFVTNKKVDFDEMVKRIVSDYPDLKNVLFRKEA